MLNQPLGDTYTQYSFRQFHTKKYYSPKRALYTLLLGRNSTPLYHQSQLAGLVGAVHVADQVDHTGAERNEGK